MISSLIVAVILGIISIPLMLGKGSQFMEGYNKSTKEGTIKYDEKKLSVSIGVTLFFIAISTGIFSFLNNDDFIIPYIVFVVAVFAGANFYKNTKCKKE